MRFLALFGGESVEENFINLFLNSVNLQAQVSFLHSSSQLTIKIFQKCMCSNNATFTLQLHGNNATFNK